MLYTVTHLNKCARVNQPFIIFLLWITNLEFGVGKEQVF